MASDGWFVRRMMRMTWLEKLLVNNPANAQRVASIAGSLLERITLPTEPRCLEIGCGQGAVSRLLVEQFGARVVVSDYDPHQTALARQRLSDLDEQIEYRVVDARAIPFGDGQFDGVFAFDVLHHIPGGWRQVVAETSRVLKQGGWFVITDTILCPRADRLLRHLVPRLDQLEERALRLCLAENGLHLEHYESGRNILTELLKNCAAVACRA